MRNIPLTLALFLVFGNVYFAYASLLTSATSEDKILSSEDEDEEVVRKWQENFAKIKKTTSTVIRMVMPYLMPTATSSDLHLSQQCRRSLFQWISDLRSMKPWALRIADASAKMMTGILTGTVASYGSFDQCVDTVVPKLNFRGQYCTIEAWPSLPPKPRFYAVNQRLKAFKRFENDTGMMGDFTKYVQLFYMFPFRVGICVPSACSASDIYNISRIVVKRLFPANISVPSCETREGFIIENYQIPIICVIGLLTFLVFWGTLTEVYLKKRTESKSASVPLGLGTEILLAFSAPANWKKLLDLEAGAEDLSVLHGIRFFTMCWIILGHTYFHLNFNILRHLQITIELTTQFIFNVVTNASVVVDNFFFLSGLLVIYVTTDMVKKIGKVPRVAYFIVHRLWRFWPIQLFFIGCSTLLPWFGDGPVWKENIDPIVNGCKTDWWANLIFINNIYRSGPKGCLSYTWYLAADFQVYIFSLPIVILVIKKPKVGLWINFVLMILSVLAVGINTYIRDLPPTLLFTRADVEQRTALMMETYYTPYYHLGPFCIGVFVGYFLQNCKNPVKIHWILRTVAWILTLTFTSSTLFGVHCWNSGCSGTGVGATVLYASLSRMAWTLGLAWITIACTFGYGGILASFLKFKALVPLSRLTFLVYMVHPLVQHVFYATLREGIQARNVLAVFICFAFIVSSYIIAIFMSLLLESPFINLGKLIFERRESAKKKNKIRAQTLLEDNTKISENQFQNSWTAGTDPRVVDDRGKSSRTFFSRTSEEISSKAGDSYPSNGVDFICHL